LVQFCDKIKYHCFENKLKNTLSYHQFTFTLSHLLSLCQVRRKSKKMKIKEIFLLFLLTRQGDLHNITILSISICEIIENFYTKYSRNVDIIDIGGSQGDLVGKIMENLNNSMTVTLQKTPQKPSHFIVENPSILLFKNFSSVWTTGHIFTISGYTLKNPGFYSTFRTLHLQIL